MRGGADREVVVYRRPGCPYCVLLTVQLRVARIGFRSVNVWRDAAASDFVRRHNGGDELVPTVLVGTSILRNPTLGQVRAAARVGTQ
jgi:glutaredoxin